MRQLEAFGGDEIRRTIERAIGEAQRYDDSVQFDFNGVVVTVAADSVATLIYRDWERAMKGYIAKEVGPRPHATLSPAEIASDAAIERRNEERRELQRQEARKERDRAVQFAAGVLSEAGPLDVDAEKWAKWTEKNKDGYGGAIVAYAERWGRMMQVGIAGGESVAEAASRFQFVADTEGITGFMHGAAVAMLADCWKHGEQLRKWHNGEYGQPESKGVVNPAVLVIG
jgi:hypothetical protein